ncbi:serine hydrolase domain-containing protein [Aurantiacibacter spongiae]|uniref:Class C beta-lactamase-related serine hydrolase n=1 Tax=Aurantiacibacter spongiae TaxID=2488860 RepID=A0A3N5CSL2_9SPHN|nr:serine hydrolase [Aurantiacibacter spongiae]RPF71346.1 class C beta-lactamase-related serine hydrolase [Aurantiacibacter spongiae]
MPRRKFPSRPALRSPALLAGLLALGACSQDGPPPEPPLPQEALAAVAADPGVPRERLARAVDDLFAAEGIGETRAVVVMHDGEVVAERYAEGFNAETRFTGWSMSKTVTGLVIGMMVADGRLRLDDPAPVARWQRPGDPRGEITLRHLLQMRSGLRHKEAVEPLYTSDEVRMLFLDGRDDMAAWAEAQPLEHEPGSTFAYSTATSVILADIATDTIAPGADADSRQRAMAEFVEARLAVPLGLRSLVGEYDASGTLVGGSHFWATARDWARLGEFLRHGGSVKGAQIVPRRWIEFMRGENPAAPDYGAQMWLNHPSGSDRTVLFPDQAPETVFAAVGHLGQYLIVSPEQRLTVLRVGKTGHEAQPVLREELGDIFALYPSR